jgi:hypothetical protein
MSAPAVPTTRRASAGNGAAPELPFQIGQTMTLSQLENGGGFLVVVGGFRPACGVAFDQLKLFQPQAADRHD